MLTLISEKVPIISDKTYFRAKNITRDKEGYFIIKVLIHQ